MGISPETRSNIIFEHINSLGLLAQQTLSFGIPTENKGIGLKNVQAKGGPYNGR